MPALIILIIILAPWVVNAEDKTSMYRLTDFRTHRQLVINDDDKTRDFAVLLSFAAIDYRQSINMFFRDEGYYEVNQVLGKNPSRREMLTFGTLGLGLTYLLAETLPKPWSQVLIDSVIVSEKMNIEENRQAHLGWNTDGPPVRGRGFSGIPIVVSIKF